MGSFRKDASKRGLCRPARRWLPSAWPTNRAFRLTFGSTTILNKLNDLGVCFRVLVDVALRSPEISMPSQDLNVPQ